MTTSQDDLHETPRCLSISDTAREACLQLQQEPLHDWIILGYNGARDSLSLVRQGCDGLGVVEMRTYLTPHGVNFGLLKSDGRLLLWTYIPEQAVNGVRRARALVHGRALETMLRHDSTFVASKKTDFTPQIVHYKLTSSRKASNPNSPVLIEVTTPERSPRVSSLPPVGTSFASDEEGEEEEALKQPDTVPALGSPLESYSELFTALVDLKLEDTAASPDQLAVDLLSPVSSVYSQASYQTRGYHSRESSMSSAQVTGGLSACFPPPPLQQRIALPFASSPSYQPKQVVVPEDPSRFYPTPPNSIERHRHRSTSSQFSCDKSKTVTTRGQTLDSKHASTASISSNSSSSKRSITFLPSPPPVALIAGAEYTFNPQLVDGQVRTPSYLAEEARRWHERERVDRERAIKNRMSKREEEATMRAKEIVEKKLQAKIEYEQRQREREAEAERIKSEREERFRQQALEKLRQEEQAQRDELRQLEDAQRKRSEDALSRAQKEHERSLLNQYAYVKKMEEEDEAINRQNEKRREQAELDNKFARAVAYGGRMLEGEVSVQGGNSIAYRRRWFELHKDRFILFKHPSEEKISVSEIYYDTIAQLVDSPEQSGAANSFMIILNTEEEWTFFTDEADAKEILMSAIEFGAHRLHYM